MNRACVLVGISLLLGIACGPHSAPGTLPDRSAQQFEACIERGMEQLRKPRLEEAVREFRQAVALRPGSSVAHNLLGVAYLRQKQTEPARRSFQEALAQDAAFAPALCNLAAIHAGSRDYGTARRLLTQAVQGAPELAAAQFSLGNVLVVMGEIKLGRQHILKAFELDPGLEMNPPRSAVSVASGDLKTTEVALAFARIYAAAGNLEESVKYLRHAHQLGFSEWKALLAEKEFEKFRDNPRLLGFPI